MTLAAPSFGFEVGRRFATGGRTQFLPSRPAFVPADWLRRSGIIHCIACKAFCLRRSRATSAPSDERASAAHCAAGERADAGEGSRWRLRPNWLAVRPGAGGLGFFKSGARHSGHGGAFARGSARVNDGLRRRPQPQAVLRIIDARPRSRATSSHALNAFLCFVTVKPCFRAYFPQHKIISVLTKQDSERKTFRIESRRDNVLYMENEMPDKCRLSSINAAGTMMERFAARTARRAWAPCVRLMEANLRTAFVPP